MAHVISFTTGKFDPSKERANRINPIAGEGVLQWIRGRLAGTPYTTTEPDCEDWGWYLDATGDGSSYMVGASGEPAPPGTKLEWTLQVHKHGSLKDKFTVKNKMATDDPFVALLERLVRGEPAFRDIHVERD